VTTDILSIGSGGGSDGTYELGGSGELYAEVEYVGDIGTGRFLQTGGTHTVRSRLSVGQSPLAYGSGSYTISGGTLDARNAAVVIGPGSPGQFNLNGGLVIADEFSRGASGSVAGNGLGTLRVNRLTGFGGSLLLDGNLEIGHSGGSGSGSYTVADGEALAVSQSLTVGYDAPGRLTHTGGTLSADHLYLGSQAGGNGTYEVSGTAETTLAALAVGYYAGTGMVVQSGGKLTASGALGLAGGPGAQGTYTMSGGELTAAKEYVGDAGVGRFIHTGGTHTVTTDILSIGSGGGSDGTYELGGSGTLSAGVEYVGDMGTGRFEQAGGTHKVRDLLSIGQSPAALGSGTYTISDGTLDARNAAVVIGLGSPGQFNLNGGLVIAEALAVGSVGTLRLDGGTLDSNSGTITVYPGGVLNVNSGTLEDVAEIQDGSLAPVPLQKTGGGKLTLRGANSYSGGTVVSDGTLEIAGAEALPCGGSLTIEAGAAVVLQNGLSAGNGSVAPVPEPGTGALLSAAMIALAGFCCWRRNRA
jgi:autotransporter-associated beta strand protein